HPGEIGQLDRLFAGCALELTDDLAVVPADLPGRHLPPAISAAFDPFQGLGLQFVPQICVEARRSLIEQPIGARGDGRSKPFMRGVPGRKLTRYTDLDRAANLIELAP